MYQEMNPGLREKMKSDKNMSRFSRNSWSKSHWWERSAVAQRWERGGRAMAVLVREKLIEGRFVEIDDISYVVVSINAHGRRAVSYDPT